MTPSNNDRAVVGDIRGGAPVCATGDVTQTDLARGALSGLVDVQERLADIDAIGICRLTSADIVRHPLVSRIVAAYADPAQDPERTAEAAE